MIFLTVSRDYICSNFLAPQPRQSRLALRRRAPQQPTRARPRPQRAAGTSAEGGADGCCKARRLRIQTDIIKSDIIQYKSINFYTV